MSSRPSSVPILPLTSVRFFAALYVVLHHSVLWSKHMQVETWAGRFLRNGYTAVGFFFVLSGYILAYVYLDTDRPFNRRAFWTSRIARAYPLLFASLLLDLPHDLLIRVSMHGAFFGTVRSFTAFLSEAALLQSWAPEFRNINGPSWSLSAEAFFYFFFPFLALWIWRRKGVGAIGLFFCMWAGAMLAPVLTTLSHPEFFLEAPSSRLFQAIELMPIFRIFEFTAGIALCSIQTSLIAKIPSARRNRLSYSFVATAVLLFVLAIQFANHIPLLVMSNGFLLPAFGLLILGLANIRGWLAALLSHRYLVILGEASYAVYLLHDPLWTYVSRLHPIDSLPIWFAFLILVLALSVASFYLLERPARKYILSRAAVRPAVTLQQEASAPL